MSKSPVHQPAQPNRTTRLVLATALGISAAVVSGCITIPSSPSPTASISTPAAFVAAKDAATGAAPTDGTWKGTKEFESLDQWWRRFEDPTLNQLVKRGLTNNLDLRLAASRVEAAAAQARVAGASLSPQVSASIPSRRSKQNFIGFPIPGSESQVLSTTSTSHGLSLTASWEADLWGKLRAGKTAAMFDARAAHYDLSAARTSLAAQLVKLYFSHNEAQQQVALDRETLESRKVTAERIDLRYQRGLASPLDIRLALAQVASIEASLAANRQRVETATRQLELLLGDYPGGTPFSSTPDSQKLRALPNVIDTVPTGLPSELLLRRPDLRAAEQRAAAAAQRVGQARGALYPSFSLTASGGTSSQDLGDLLESNFSVWSLATNLLQPIFQGGRLRAAVDANLAAHEQTLLQWVQLTLRAFSEVETQLVLEGLTQDRLAALERSLKQTREAERLATDRYLAGLATYLDLLDSQRQAFVAESLLLGARRQRLDARVDLILALGGGYQEDPNHQMATISDTALPAGSEN